LQQVERQGAYADVALHRVLSQRAWTSAQRAFITEVALGMVRRRRTLDAWLHHFCPKGVPPDIRHLVHLGMYQIAFLDRVPSAAAVHSTVELVKAGPRAGLAGLVNGVLRAFLRADREAILTTLGDRHSYPDWLVALWEAEWGDPEPFCEWFNQPPALDLRVNPLQTNRETLAHRLQAAGFTPEYLPDGPHGLRVRGATGAIPQLPGFAEGEWSVQDAAAQRAVPLLDPQPGEILIDACAAPGGKTTHLAEYTGDRATIWACDVHPHRLRTVTANAQRLGLQSIRVRAGDSRQFRDWEAIADRVLLDVPCSGLGTLHHHADARWRMTPAQGPGLVQLQQELLAAAARWVKPGGVLLYVTCTLHRAENEGVIQQFLATHPHWQGVPLPWAEVTPEGFGYTSPRGDRSGFFFAKLRHAPRFAS